MVRNRSTSGTVSQPVKKLIDKFAGIMLIVSAIVIWLVIIIALGFLVFDNHRMRGAIRVHDENDEKYSQIRAELREDVDKNQRLLAGIRSKLTDLEKRIGTLGESHKK